MTLPVSPTATATARWPASVLATWLLPASRSSQPKIGAARIRAPDHLHGGDLERISRRRHVTGEHPVARRRQRAGDDESVAGQGGAGAAALPRHEYRPGHADPSASSSGASTRSRRKATASSSVAGVSSASSSAAWDADVRRTPMSNSRYARPGSRIPSTSSNGSGRQSRDAAGQRQQRPKVLRRRGSRRRTGRSTSAGAARSSTAPSTVPS